MKYKITALIILAILLSFTASAANRWYDDKIVASGCYPPPPLNGSAHAWHHSIPQLARSIKQGGIQMGGV